jgi:hypothetical protein
MYFKVEGSLFAPYRPMQFSWRNTCISSKKSPLSEKLHHLAHSFPVRVELVFKGILPATWVFQSGHRLSLLQTCLFNWVDETHVSRERKSVGLEPVACSTLFLCENWVSFWRGYVLEIIVLKVEIKSQFVPNQPSKLSWRDKWISWRKSSMIEAGAPSTLFPCENWVVVERNTSCNLCVWLWR